MAGRLRSATSRPQRPSLAGLRASVRRTEGAMVRFGVWQCGKLRPCDNGRSSLHNLAAELFERLTVESADFPARAAALYAELMGDSMSFAFTLGAEDVQAAYRRQRGVVEVVDCRNAVEL